MDPKVIFITAFLLSSLLSYCNSTPSSNQEVELSLKLHKLGVELRGHATHLLHINRGYDLWPYARTQRQVIETMTSIPPQLLIVHNVVAQLGVFAPLSILGNMVSRQLIVTLRNMSRATDHHMDRVNMTDSQEFYHVYQNIRVYTISLEDSYAILLKRQTDKKFDRRCHKEPSVTENAARLCSAIINPRFPMSIVDHLVKRFDRREFNHFARAVLFLIFRLQLLEQICEGVQLMHDDDLRIYQQIGLDSTSRIKAMIEKLSGYDDGIRRRFYADSTFNTEALMKVVPAIQDLSEQAYLTYRHLLIRYDWLDWMVVVFNATENVVMPGPEGHRQEISTSDLGSITYTNEAGKHIWLSWGAKRIFNYTIHEKLHINWIYTAELAKQHCRRHRILQIFDVVCVTNGIYILLNNNGMPTNSLVSSFIYDSGYSGSKGFTKAYPIEIGVITYNVYFTMTK